MKAEALSAEDQIIELVKEADGLEAGGNYEAAGVIWERLLIDAEQELDSGNALIASIASRLAFTYTMRALYSQAEPLYKRALAIREKALGPDHPDTVTSIDNLGMLYSRQGLFSQAEIHLEQALSIRIKKLGPNHLQVAQSQTLLASIYIHQNLPSKAQPLLERALAITEETPGSDTALISAIIGLLLEIHGIDESNPALVAFLSHALEISEKNIGADSPETLNLRFILATQYKEQGRDQEAESLLLQNLSLSREKYGDNHSLTGDQFHALGTYYLRRNDEAAAELLSKALAIRARNFGVNHSMTARAMAMLALAEQNLGNLQEAIQLLGKSIPVLQDGSAEDVEFSDRLFEMQADYLLRAGDYQESIKAYKEMLSLRASPEIDLKDSLGMMANLAKSLTGRGLLAEAELIYSDMLQKAESVNAENKNYIEALVNVGFIRTQISLHREAESAFSKAVVVADKLYSQNSRYANEIRLLRDYSRMLIAYRESYLERKDDLGETAWRVQSAFIRTAEELGKHYTKEGKLDSLDNAGLLFMLGEASLLASKPEKAKEYYADALSIRARLLGAAHPEVAILHESIGVIDLMLGQPNQALTALRDAERIRSASVDVHSRRNINSLYLLAVASHAVGDHAARALYLRRLLTANLLNISRESAQLSLGQRERSWRNEFESAFSLAISDGAPEDLTLAIDYRISSHALGLEVHRLQSLLASASQEAKDISHDISSIYSRLANVAVKADERIRLRRIAEDKEKLLYQILPELRIPIVSAVEAAAALPKNGLLVEFQAYRPWVGGSNPWKLLGSKRYQALILRPNGTVDVVQLGEAEPIEKAIAAAFTASAGNELDATARLAEVSDLVLKPLAPHLAGSRQLFLSPDGELHRVPFAALPSPSQPGEVLARSVQLRLLTTGRDLVRFQKPPQAGKAPLVIANPNYDRGRSSPSTLIATAHPKQRWAELDNAKWAPLPATAREGEQIASLLGTQPISGDAATVSLLQRSAGPKVLHIASHGFFVADQEIQPDDPRSALIAGGGQVARFQGEDPLLRSGIVLAGANNPSLDPNDDGLLTALEATALQLDGTELVVLSACSTGAGDIQSGEGLYGLQRALTVAGARTTLLSLWKVDDRATASFMEAFYKRLKAGVGRADALADTQADFRSGVISSRKQGEDWSEHYYWAAWQLVGDWRPVQGL
ncbi:CHAT domain-containing protein [Cyanobium sp. CH-040]|nr:CHAT domain-containing protein [Cyanobium sp. CH-040]